MKATVIKKDYPKLMKNRLMDYIVLFAGERRGTVVYTDGPYYIGFSCETWMMDEFVDFNGSVILEG